MSRSAALRRPQFRLGAVIAIAIAAGLVAWLLLRDDGDSSSKPAQVAGATTTTKAKLADLAAEVQHPIFWLGPKRGFTYELTQTGNGKIYVRYLPDGVDVGADKPYLTVATYPFPGAYPAIKKQAAAKGAVTARLASGGLAVLDNRLSPERPHRLPGRELPGRGLRPHAGTGDAARLVRPAQAPRPPEGEPLGGRDPERRQADRGLRRRAEVPRQRARSPDLLGRGEAGVHVRADQDDLGERLHPLPPGRREGRRPEGRAS